MHVDPQNGSSSPSVFFSNPTPKRDIEPAAHPTSNSLPDQAEVTKRAETDEPAPKVSEVHSFITMLSKLGIGCY